MNIPENVLRKGDSELMVGLRVSLFLSFQFTLCRAISGSQMMSYDSELLPGLAFPPVLPLCCLLPSFPRL